MGVAIFRALDVDGNGKLDAKEIAAAGDVLKKLANSNGEITRQELLKSLPPEMSAAAGGGLQRGGSGGGLAAINPEAAFKRIMEQFDKNADGKLQKDELPRPLQERFEELDTNKDGGAGSSGTERNHAALDAPHAARAGRRGAGGKGKKSENN